MLNADFRRTNADAGTVPAVFTGVAADARIEFALAVRDPNCAATTGITRTNTATAGFTWATRNNIKSAATGGADPWPSDRYLNFWVANFTDDTLGFATFPGGIPARDGFVVDTEAFGTIGTATAPFNLGRTGTHEIGHWLNLLHIWGDDQLEADICSFSDECADTPNQGIANVGTPTFPRISCGNGPNGDMFMNYMDYVDDAVMVMFTQSQVTRMHATLSVARASILASDGLVPPDAPATPDLWMQDNGDDTGAEPNPSTGPMWVSDDIWVRNGSDGLANQDHQNPRGGEVNNVYVRVRNRGCPAAGVQSGTLKLYWAKASTSLAWPAPWDGSVPGPPAMGGPIGSQAVSVAGGGQQILSFPWTPPDPSDYAYFGADAGHFCLLARIETSATAPFGMSAAETSNLYANVKDNNNIVWKNISVVDTDGDGARMAAVVVGQFAPGGDEISLSFEIPEVPGENLFDWGRVEVDFRGALEPWRHRLDEQQDGLWIEKGRLVVVKPGTRIIGPAPGFGRFGAVRLQFVEGQGRTPGARIFPLDLVERDAAGAIVGGQRVLFRTGRANRAVWDRQLGTFDGVDWRPAARPCCCDWWERFCWWLRRLFRRR